MADLLTPMAPPETGAAIAPPDINNPVALGSGLSFPQPVDLHSQYEDAIQSGSPAEMYSLTSRAKGTPYESVIKNSAQVMNKNLGEFERDVAPVAKAGGIETPEGRIAASKTYETIADKPQKMRAFVEMLMGNPNWRTFVTGGTVKTEIAYDSQGNQLEKQTNEIGQLVSVIDSATGKPIDRQQLAARGGLVPSLDSALGYQQKKEVAKYDAEAFNKSNAATNDYTARADMLKSKYAEIRQNLQNLYGSDLTDDQRNQIALFSNRTAGYSQSISKGLNALEQKIDNKNVNLSASDQKSLGSTLEALGMRVGADGSIRNAKGEAVTKTDLNQAQSTLLNGSQFERNFSQSKADFINSQVFKDLGAGEKQLLSRTLDLQQEVEKANMELVGKHGTLPFIINPKSYELGDQFAKGEVTALIGEFNADATKMFKDWRDQKLEAYKRSGTVPKPGELEARFVDSPEYKALKAATAEKNKEIMRRPTSERTFSSNPSELNIGQQEPASIQTRTAPAKTKTKSISDLASQFRSK